MKPTTLPPQKYLREALRYERSTGRLFWRTRPRSHFKKAGTRAYWNRRYAGTEAFAAVMPTWGHLRGRLDKQSFLAHRVVWKLVRGTEPPPIIDHKDRNPKNNRNKNLRAATNAQNCANGKRQGIYFDKAHDRWRAHVSVNGKKKQIGEFSTREEAFAARVAKAREIYGEFAAQ